MHADLKKLIRLQSIDIAVQELQENTGAFPARSKALDDKLRDARAGVDKAREAIGANQSRRKELEATIADTEVKISKYKEQLMSVKTNDEYKAMVKEIGFNEKAISSVEDEILLLMEESETLSAALKSAEATLREDDTSVQAERARLEELNAQDTKALDSNLDERSGLGKEVDEDVLARYERVRRFRGGIAMARASDEACEVCNVRMRPQVFQEVRRNDHIIPCDSCGRILYDPENLDHPFEVA